MYQAWKSLTFLHWRYEPGEVQRLLPRGLEVEVFDGSAWVGITPFLLDDLRWPGIPPLPWLSRSPETNVRTYVRGPDGRAGIWFFSLDIARAPAVLFARAVYFLPYMWSSLKLEREGNLILYGGRRCLPGPGARYRIEVEIGAPYSDAELEDLDHFLTARWVLFTFYGRRAAASSVEHPPWPLWRARARSVDQTLLQAAGLPAGRGQPLVHFSPGVDTRISAPYLVRPG